MFRSNIIKTIKETNIYPNKNNAYEVECEGKNGEIYTAILPKEEVNLALYLRAKQNTGIKTDVEFNTLLHLIEEYGDQRYQEAADDAAMNSAGADL